MSQPEVIDQVYRCSDQFDVLVSERSETKATEAKTPRDDSFLIKVILEDIIHQ